MASAQGLSQLDQQEFVDALDGIFEHSPWLAERVWSNRPFDSRAALLQALYGELHKASRDEQTALVRAHPELAGKAAVRGELTEESTREQASARLDACSPEEFERLQNLNAAYREKFGFPFIIAVRGLNRAQIIEQFSARLENIAALRLQERVEE